MSHNITLAKGHKGKFWYALCDKNGKVRDWTQEDNVFGAHFKFCMSRKSCEYPNGYSIELRGKVA